MGRKRAENPRDGFCRDEAAAGAPRRPVRRQARLAGLAMALALVAGAVMALPCAAQQGQSPEDRLMAQSGMPGAVFPPIPPNLTDGFGRTDFVWTPKRLEMINIDRQKTMVADANKLLKLAKKLNAEVNGADAGALTQDQLSEVKEIEKLAHKVRGEMSFSVQRPPYSGPLLTPLVVP